MFSLSENEPSKTSNSISGENVRKIIPFGVDQAYVFTESAKYYLLKFEEETKTLTKIWESTLGAGVMDVIFNNSELSSGQFELGSINYIRGWQKRR